MTLKKTNYPYYAKWWFFICVIFLSWITPITSNWKTYIFGEQVDAKLVMVYDKEVGSIIRKYFFEYQGKDFFSRYKEVSHSKEMPMKVKVYFNGNNPKENFVGVLEYFYFGKRLMFPILFQMIMIVFFFLVRTKEY